MEGFDYARARRDFSLDIPKDFNFAFDVVRPRALSADKTAIIEIDKTGRRVTHHAYSDLETVSNRFANVLLGLGATKGDFAFVMIPRQVEWYHTLLGAMKVGVVSMPATNLLTAKDIEYRVNRSGAKLVIVTAALVWKSRSDQNQLRCKLGEHLIVVGDDVGAAPSGWVKMSEACAHVSGELERGTVPRNRAEDPMLIYFAHRAPPRCRRWLNAISAMASLTRLLVAIG